MALDYADLFADLGKLIKHSDLQKTDGTNLAADLQDILDEFQDASQDLAIEGLASDFEGWEREYEARRLVLADYATRRLQDRTTVLAEIGAVTTSIDEILSRLLDRMYLDTASVNASSVALGAVAAVSGNTGNGTVITSTTLDGYTSPGSLSGVSFASHRRYANVASELAAPSETMALECVSDSYRDGVTEGSESFAWTGGVPIDKLGIDSEGSGDCGVIQCIHAASLLANLDFEDFATADTPDSWDIDAGTAGTHINEQTPAGANVYHGDSSLNFLGDGALASIQISQTIPAGTVQGNRAYFVTARIKADAAIAAGTLTIQFEGTGYTASSSERIQIAPGSLPTSWTLYSFLVVMPDDLPSNMELVVKWTGTPTNAKNVWIDDIGFAPAVYAGGVAAIPVRGATPFVRGDKFTFTVTNTEGVIQRFFRRVFGFQLRSNSAGAETIGDALAT